MLTVDLVRVRRKKDKTLAPAYLSGANAERVLPIAAAYIALHRDRVGATRDELDDAVAAIDVPARDRVAALGLRKVIEDRCAFDVHDGDAAEALRAEVFAASARAHKALGVREELDRGAVLVEVAERLATTPDAIEAGLYADLRGNEKLASVDVLTPEGAVERYNLGLAQAILLRATRVTVHLDGETARSYRRVFRAARFHQLIHVVRRASEGGYDVELDGPFSLFDSVQRYGQRLAMFLPAVLGCRSFRVRADVLWGKEREPFTFEVGPEDGLVPHAAQPDDSSPELDAFCAAFGRLASAWRVRASERVFALPGEIVCVPDLVFENAETGEEVYMEVFGFWSRAAVWQRVELIQKGGLGCRIVLAVQKHLRVSEELLGDDEGGRIYVYKTAMSPRAVLALLDGEKR